MKILLVAINAKYIHSNLAVYCLKAYAEKNMPQDVNVQIELAEYTINQNRDEILKDIYRRQAEMICFSCYIWNLDYVESMIRDVKKVMKDVIIWAGGPEVSYDGPAVLTRLPEADGVMKGEGEQTFCELIEFYNNTFITRIIMTILRNIKSKIDYNKAQTVRKRKIKLRIMAFCCIIVRQWGLEPTA